MNDPSGRIDKIHKSAATGLHYPPVSCRRMRNTAILVKWIEEHQSNPYPTKAEKQYLGYYSGMNLTQLSTWFANARRRIKKIGMKVWLEGRSTFTVDFFPTPSSARTAMNSDSYSAGTAGSYATSPYLYPQLASGYTNQTSTATLGLPSQRMQLSNGPCSVYSADSTSAYCGTVSSSSLYGSQQRSTPLIGMPNLSWPVMPSSTQLLPTTSSLSTIPPPPRPSSHNVPPIHSPLTAQVYSDPLRAQTSLDVSDGSYSYPQQQSPDQMLPECASSEPTTMLQESPKNHYHSHTE